jgi:hypothetical protein
MRARLCVKSASDKKARGCGVSVIPGEIVFTRMLSAEFEEGLRSKDCRSKPGNPVS